MLGCVVAPTTAAAAAAAATVAPPTPGYSTLFRALWRWPYGRKRALSQRCRPKWSVAPVGAAGRLRQLVRESAEKQLHQQIGAKKVSPRKVVLVCRIAELRRIEGSERMDPRFKVLGSRRQPTKKKVTSPVSLCGSRQNPPPHNPASASNRLNWSHGRILPTATH